MNAYRDMDERAQDEDRRELEQRTVEAIRAAIERGMPEGDARLLCWQAGIDYEHAFAPARIYTRPLPLPDGVNPF